MAKNMTQEVSDAIDERNPELFREWVRIRHESDPSEIFGEHDRAMTVEKVAGQYSADAAAEVFAVLCKYIPRVFPPEGAISDVGAPL